MHLIEEFKRAPFFVWLGPAEPLERQSEARCVYARQDTDRISASPHIQLSALGWRFLRRNIGIGQQLLDLDEAPTIDWNFRLYKYLTIRDGITAYQKQCDARGRHCADEPIGGQSEVHLNTVGTTCFSLSSVAPFPRLHDFRCW